MKGLVLTIFASLLLSVAALTSTPMAPSAQPVSAPVTAIPTPPSSPQPYEIVPTTFTVPLNSIILLQCGSWRGTAEVINGNTLLTASHVIAHNKVCTFQQNGQTRLARVVYDNVKMDYAVLYADTSKKPRIPINCGGFIPGQTYMMVGYAHGVDFVVQTVVATSEFSDMTSKTKLEFNHVRTLQGVIGGRPSAISGMSGGPIFNLRGEMVGTTIASPTDDHDAASFSRELRDTYICQTGKITPQSK